MSEICGLCDKPVFYVETGLCGECDSRVTLTIREGERVMATFELPNNVSLEIFDFTAYDTKRQDSVWYDELVASLTYKEGEIEESVSVYCLGDMELYYQEKSLYSAGDIISAGINNDEELYKIENQGGEWINNSWFEVLGEEDECGIYHSAKEAIEEGARELVRLVKQNKKEGVYA